MLVDGHYCLYAAFYSTLGHDLTNSRGEPTGALVGFMSTIHRLQRDFQPSHFAVMMDTAAQSERKKAYPAYKSNRSCPSDLMGQFSKARDACEAMSVPWKAVDGYEADDLIATYATEAAKDCSVSIVSPDKDLMQLASREIHIHSNLQDFNNYMDNNAVEARWGVRPSQMGDLLALTGDASDNLPGVPGIGMKKAAQLLGRHGNLAGIFEAARVGRLRVPGVGPKLTRSLLDNEELALEIRKLVELMNVPDLDATAWRNFKAPQRDWRWLETAKAFLERENMTHMLERLSTEVVASFPRACSSRTRAARPPPPTARVEDLPAAERAMEVLRRHSGDEGRLFGVSVEASEDHPRAICFSVYGGDDLDFGGGPRLWVDLLGAQSGELLDAFSSFFGDSRFRKVYHCLSEQWRPLSSSLEAVTHDGFAGDTMHMARLLDPSLKSYQLEELGWRMAVRGTVHHEHRQLGLRLRPKGQGVKAHMPADELQLQRREEWVQYASSGAQTVHELYKALRKRLMDTKWELEGPQGTPEDIQGLSMWDFYLQYWQPLGSLLLEMELTGMPVDMVRLDELEKKALEDMNRDKDKFTSWALRCLTEEHGPDSVASSNLADMNLNSARQLSHLLFGAKGEVQRFQVREEADDDASASSSAGAAPETGRDEEPSSGDDSVAPEAGPLVREELEQLKVDDLKALLRQRGLKIAGVKAALIDRLLDPESKPVNYTSQRWRKVTVTLQGLGLQPPNGFRTKLTRKPQVTMEALKALATEQAAKLGPEGEEALAALVRRQEVEAVLSGFLRPLHSHVADGRVHAYMNLNTETGRLSCRQPNLMGEPLGKLVPLREAFAAAPGRSLVVADYGQLELRVLAHLADCKPMIELLSSGGDIHSQTAYQMFPEVREAVDAGEASLAESSGAATVKDAFPEQRRRAKVMNFSVLYGKTSYTLALEWGVSQGEAEELIRAWYASFPEVRKWKAQAERAAAAGASRTLLGRSRPVWRKLEQAESGQGAGKGQLRRRFQVKAHALRAASNSPVQGSAADIAIAAMLRMKESPRLRKLGYRQVLQVHDEVLLEGPEANAEEAVEEVVALMKNPLPFRLRVPLEVDARHAKTWQEGKA